ncbi:hypothetical protein DLAC_04436 [Tieghemostelium lacteum]|uniref:F-box domain-containing protein n=1 Tax=Tieghemostelium lacteum TaxID=361077 RepID=A0A151ZJU1_TIELA|nr:hypothetical protein DLAC_04436 [Tieghemostelium lacteum]|eukprot:KYQ94150.1 hypothetical protein DLAC_04436 [Tieghemostelium lacteum]
MNTLPNLIVQYILEHLLKKSDKLIYYVDFIRYYTLISKQWNREIIPKLRLGNITIHTGNRIPIIKKWAHLVNRFDIQHTISIYYFEKLREWTDMIKENITSIAQYPKSNFSLDDHNYFKNINTVKLAINLNYETFKSDLFVPIDNVEYECTLIGHETQLDDLKHDQDLPVVMFNQNFFKSINLYDVTLKHRMPLGKPPILNTKLLHLKINDGAIHHNIINSIFENCGNLETLHLTNVVVVESPVPDVDCLCQVVQNARFSSLKQLVLRIVNPIHFTTIVSLLNNISVSQATLDFRDILYDSIEQVLTSQITNTTIRKMEFVKNTFKPNVKELEYFSFADIWTDKSHLTKIRIHKCFDYSGYLSEMVRLKSIEIHENNTKVNQTAQDTLEAAIKLNIPPLKSIRIVSINYTTSRLQISSKILKFNNHITSVVLNGISLQDCYDIINSDHPSLTKLCVYYLVFSDSSCRDFNKLLIPIQSNRNMKYLALHGTEWGNFNYNIFDFLISILKLNSNYIQLIVPEKGGYQDQHLLSFKQILKSNTTIKQLGTFDKLPEKLSTLFHIHSIKY